jgi:hypothetical protein
VLNNDDRSPGSTQMITLAAAARLLNRATPTLVRWSEAGAFPKLEAAGEELHGRHHGARGLVGRDRIGGHAACSPRACRQANTSASNT